MRPETKALYPPDWPAISKQLIASRGYHCQNCGTKPAIPYPILTVHHKDYNPANNNPTNLIVLCQGCHLALQARARTMLRLLAKGQHFLPGLEPVTSKNLI